MLPNSGKVVGEDADNQLTVVADFGIESELFGKVLQVRGDGGKSQPQYEFDEYSTHYVLFHNCEPIGSLTATRHVDGKIDCEEFYPAVLFDRYGEQLASICKFRIRPGSHSGMKTFRMMVRGLARSAAFGSQDRCH